MQTVNHVELNMPVYDMVLSAIPVENLLTGLNVTDSSFRKNDVPVKKQNVRKELINELYQIYLQECNKEYYVKNKKRFYAYCKRTHPDGLEDRRVYESYKSEFRAAKLPEHQKYLKPIDSNDGAWWYRFSHLKGEEGNECLRVIISTAKEMKTLNKGNVISYILGSAGKLSV